MEIFLTEIHHGRLGARCSGFGTSTRPREIEIDFSRFQYALWFGSEIQGGRDNSIFIKTGQEVSTRGNGIPGAFSSSIPPTRVPKKLSQPASNPLGRPQKLECG